MNQSDVEYEAIMRELKAELFCNRCRQERLGEHLWRLEKEKGELDTEKDRLGAEENSDLEKKLCGNHGLQEKIREQLQGLEKRLRTVEATVSVEEFLQDKADEVGCVKCEELMERTVPCIFYCQYSCDCVYRSTFLWWRT